MYAKWVWGGGVHEVVFDAREVENLQNLLESQCLTPREINLKREQLKDFYLKAKAGIWP